MRSLVQLHHYILAVNSSLIDWNRLRSRKCGLPCKQVEARAVARADDTIAIDLAFRQRSVIVRAHITEGHNAALNPRQRNRCLVDVDSQYLVILYVDELASVSEVRQMGTLFCNVRLM